MMRPSAWAQTTKESHRWRAMICQYICNISFERLQWCTHDTRKFLIFCLDTLKAPANNLMSGTNPRPRGNMCDQTIPGPYRMETLSLTLDPKKTWVLNASAIMRLTASCLKRSFETCSNGIKFFYSVRSPETLWGLAAFNTMCSLNKLFKI